MKQFHVSCIEVDPEEDAGAQLAALGVAVVGLSAPYCERVLDDIVTQIESDGGIVVGDMQVETYTM